ncbi:hypothetical protein D1872_51500 [compost metagenome]
MKIIVRVMKGSSLVRKVVVFDVTLASNIKLGDILQFEDKSCVRVKAIYTGKNPGTLIVDCVASSVKVYEIEPTDNDMNAVIVFKILGWDRGEAVGKVHDYLGHLPCSNYSIENINFIVPENSGEANHYVIHVLIERSTLDPLDEIVSRYNHRIEGLEVVEVEEF